MIDFEKESKQTLRQRAEEKLRAYTAATLMGLSLDEAKILIHELHTHQIELEMQNKELQRSQIELATSRERYQDLYDLAPVGYLSLSEKGIILKANLTAAKQFGVARGALVKQPLFCFLLAGEMDSYYLKHKKLLATGKPQAWEMQILRADGSLFWAYLQATLVLDGESRITLSDITEQKQTEEALRYSEGKYRSIMESMDDGVYVCSPDFKIEFMNPAMIKRSGRDAIGEPCHEVIYGVDKKCSWCVIEKVIQGEHILTEVFSPLNDNTYNVFSSPIFNKDGSVSKLTISRDITETKKLEDQYRQAQKMESVGRLAGGVAHDYNNALTVIIGFTELIKDDVDLPELLRADLDQVLAAADRAKEITRQLLAFARKQIIAPRVLDLNANVESMLKILRHLIGENIDLSWLPAASLLLVKMDPSQIDQILANLCVNARDAIKDVGKITIETGTVVIDAEYCTNHRGFAPGEFVTLTVSDNGCGIEKEILDRIFEPFFTTKDVDKGTGLGLSMVYGIVKQNKGFISVYSEPGKGTSINIHLPRHEGKAAEIEVESTAAIPPSRGETILLVEDDLSLLKLAHKMLDRQGYAVLTANLPTEAMILASDHPGEIDLLVTDVIMPEMNGRELAGQLQSLYPDLKSIFMSGYTANVIAHHNILDEEVDFIQKPFSKRDLAKIVRQVLDKG